jgi:hypothetical protein
MTRPSSPFPLRVPLSFLLLAFALGSAFPQTSLAYNDLHDFGGKVVNANGKLGPDGIYPTTEVIFDSLGDMFGTTNAGGAFGGGIVWEITATGVYKDLHDFGGTVVNANGKSGPDGATPAAAPSLDLNGNIYGTTASGGPYLQAQGGGGNLWKTTSTGKYSDLHDFGGSLFASGGGKVQDGANPGAQFLVSGDGQSFLGTAETAGAFNGGVLWQIAAYAGYSIVHNFGGALVSSHSPDGVSPDSNIVFDLAGNAYGTTEYGGALLTNMGGGGIIWKLTPEGVYSDWFDFGGTASYGGVKAPAGRWPVGPIIIYFGILYGTCSGGGPAASTGGEGLGSQWVNGSDSYYFGGTTVSVNGKKVPDGIYPTGVNTMLYGTTSYGGANDALDGGDGIVWEQEGSSVDLHDFGGTVINADGKKGPDGKNPAAPTAHDPNWNLVGTTQFGGPYDAASGGDGMVWRITTALQSISLTSSSVLGGVSESGEITLAGPAPWGGTYVSLTSSSPSATVPSSVLVARETESTAISVNTTPVAAKTTVTITAILGTIKKTATFTIVPPSVTGVAASPNPVPGGTSCTGTVHLNGAAPTGGTTVTLSSNSKLLVVPAKVVVAAGSSSGKFTITATAVDSNQTATISARTGSALQTATVTIEAPSFTGFSISPTSFVGASSTAVTGKVRIGSPAPTGGAVVTLTSSLPAAASVPSSVTIPTGATSATFTVKHSAVKSAQYVTVKAAYGKSTKSVTLNITP